MLERFKKFQFLFEELVKRDFKKKYKRTFFGMLWSIFSPLLQLLVQSLVFTQFFGRNTPHFTIYLFSGNLIFSYFSDATSGGMRSLLSNASIITRVNVPKYMFLFSRVVQSFINFLLTLAVYFVFVAIDGIPFRLTFFSLVYPILFLTVFNIGMGMILSALYVFFRDIEYLYSVFTMLLMYVSAIFYNVEAFAPHIQRLFLANPIYVYIKYFRVVVIDGGFPSLEYHLLGAGYAILTFLIGFWIYRKNNYKFLYYI